MADERQTLAIILRYRRQKYRVNCNFLATARPCRPQMPIHDRIQKDLPFRLVFGMD